MDVTQGTGSAGPRRTGASWGWAWPGVVMVLSLAGWLVLPGSRPAPEPSANRAFEEIPRSSLALRDGRLCRLSDGRPFSGFMVEQYPSGSMQSRSRVVEGVLDGLSEGWYESGQLQVSEVFQGGLSHGVRTRWYPDGARQSEATTDRGELVGTFRRWHENGVLSEQAEMSHGQAEGLSMAFHPSGYLRARVVIRGGAVQEQRFWQDGEQRVEGVALADSRSTR